MGPVSSLGVHLARGGNVNELYQEEDRPEMMALAKDLLSFLDAAPCAFHATEELARRVSAAGFVELDPRQPFALEPSGRYFLRRGGSAIVAFIVGDQSPGQAGFRIIGAHCDSPTFKVKPQPDILKGGLVHLGVEVYGGPLLASWTDRDLGICGRVVLEPDGGGLQTRLFKTGSIVSVPNVAIHLNRKANDEGLKLNPQTQFTPLLGAVGAGLPERHAFLHLLADEVQADPAHILAFDAYLFDTQPAAFSGVDAEFVRSGRLDDLAMCHAGVRALLAVADTSTPGTRVLVCYDNEEVGSLTAQGARSNLLPSVLERICLAQGEGRAAYLAALAGSRLVSADNAHAVHPGYADRSDPSHGPVLNGGPVIKRHASRAYATDAWAAGFFQQACRQAGVPWQDFVNRSDSRSGGTIGSMTSAQLGVATVDVGNAQYAMHSVREMGGTWDTAYMTRALQAFLLQ